MAAVLTSYTTGDDGQWVVPYGALDRLGQTFTLAEAAELSEIKVLIFRTGSPGTCSIALYTTDIAGAPDTLLHTFGFSGNVVTADGGGEWKAFPFDDSLAAGKYAILIHGGSDVANSLSWRMDQSSPTYAGGNLVYKIGAGAWTDDTGGDFMFEVSGEGESYVFTPPVGIVTKKRAIAAARDRLYYEDI